MKTVRIIPRLDIKWPNLVKGIHLEGLRVLGEPKEFARYYSQHWADELAYVDIVASLYQRNSLQEFISITAKEIFIPLTVGGGLRSIEDITEVLRAGADKVSLNTADINNPEIIREASNRFGSSTILIAIEAIKQPDGSYHAYTDNGRETTGKEVVARAQEVESLGAGEIQITSVDKEWTGEGFDIELTKSIVDAVNVPVIAHGGAGSKEDIAQVIREAWADAVSIASIIHYDFIKHTAQLDKEYTEGNLEFLSGYKNFEKISSVDIRDIKNYLSDQGIPCRWI